MCIRFNLTHLRSQANVNLSPPEGHKGGRLLLGVGGAIKEASPRGEGDAALHVGDVAHAVTGKRARPCCWAVLHVT